MSTRTSRLLTRAGIRLRARARGALILGLGATLVIQALGVVTGVISARVLGPSARGELAAVLLWPTLLTAVGSLGAHDGLTYYAAREGSAVKSLVVTAAKLAGVQGLVLVGTGAILMPIILGRFGAVTVRAGWYYVAAIPIALFALYLMSILNGLHKFGWFSFLRVLVIAGGALGVVFFAAVGRLTVTSAVLATIGGIVITAVLAAIVVHKLAAGPGGPARSFTRDVTLFGLRSHVSSVSNLLNDRLDQLVISLFLPPAQLGLYVVAWTMTSLTGIVGATVAVVALPAIARTAEGPERIVIVRRYMLLTVSSATLIVAPLIVTAGPLVHAAFGPRFDHSVVSARLLLVGSIVLALTRVLGAVLKGINRPLDAGFAEAAGLLITVVGLVVLLPLLGILGAAVVSLAAYTTTAGVGWFRLTRALGVSSRLLVVGFRRGSLGTERGGSSATGHR